MIQVAEFITLRKAKGLSQADLAGIAGVSQQLISEIERGVTRTTKKIYKIAKVLGVPVNQLDPELPEWDEDFSQIISDLRKLPTIDSARIKNKLKRDIKTAQRNVTPKKSLRR